MAASLAVSLSPEEFIEKSCVLIYVEDAVQQLLEYKDDNPKVNVTKFFSSYFASVKAGTHVILREYSYVKATLHNRSSFVCAVWKCFTNIGKKGDMMSELEFHSLFSLLCPDLPFSLIQKSSRIVQMADSHDRLMSFTDFLYAFQLQFCYNEFLSKCATVYSALTKRTPARGTDAVVVPTSEKQSRPEEDHGEKRGDEGGGEGGAKTDGEGVNATHYGHSLKSVIDQTSHDCPTIEVINEALSGSERTTFYKFLKRLSNSEELNKNIGKLPPRSQLFVVSDQEIALTSVTPVVRGNAWIENKPSSDQILSHPSSTSRGTSSTNKTSQKSSVSSARPFSSDTPSSRTPSGDSARSGRIKRTRHVLTLSSSNVSGSKSVAMNRVVSSSSESGSFKDSSDSDNY